MSLPPTKNSEGEDLSFMGQEAVESNIHSDAAITSTTSCEAPVCVEGDTEASISFHSQSTAIVGDDVNDDAEFEKEMRLMLAGRHPQTTYSRKVFLGGLPHYTSSDDLQKFFSAFGAVEIVWPTESGDSEQETTTYGYAFAVFASAESVASLLEKCANIGGKYSISAPVSGKNNVAIHIRVWLNRNAEYCSDNSVEFMDVLTKNAVFVGGLPRTVTASEFY
ncbi:hypothetical protein GCK32_016049 [Trichostrongylus colubriformis]|uniref:RRM domain-containing protein n=1 Tax=Trichostrongylus colubriformis TaxID=6319 RepID=A0AAN8FLW4_TRICO